MMKRVRANFIVLLVGVLAGGGAFAHSGATGIVKQRMDAMADVGKNMKAIAAMMKGETAFDAAVVKTSAEAIAGHAKDIPDLFPEGSDQKPSEAIAAIWKDWDRFVKIAEGLEADAVSLAGAATTANGVTDIRRQLAAVGKSCKACHEDFRLKK